MPSVGEISVDLRMNSMEFTNNVKQAEREMKSLRQQFKLAKDVTSSYGNTTTGLKAQMGILNSEYRVTQARIKKYTEEYNRLQSAYDGDKTGETSNKMQKYKNNLNLATLELSKIAYQQQEVQKQLMLSQNGFYQAGTKLADFGDKAWHAGSRIQEFGRDWTRVGIVVGGATGMLIRSAMNFQTAVTGVYKTVDGTPEQLAKITQGIRDMAMEIPSTTTEISSVAEAAGQLGVKTDDILTFTRVMIDMGNSTNLSANDAAIAIAKIANITGMTSDEYARFGSATVALGNNFSTTESDIVQMANRLASAGTLAGLTEPQILGLATAMSSVGKQQCPVAEKLAA